MLRSQNYKIHRSLEKTFVYWNFPYIILFSKCKLFRELVSFHILLLYVCFHFSMFTSLSQRFSISSSHTLDSWLLTTISLPSNLQQYSLSKAFYYVLWLVPPWAWHVIQKLGYILVTLLPPLHSWVPTHGFLYLSQRVPVFSCTLPEHVLTHSHNSTSDYYIKEANFSESVTSNWELQFNHTN